MNTKADSQRTLCVLRGAWLVKDRKAMMCVLREDYRMRAAEARAVCEYLLWRLRPNWAQVCAALEQHNPYDCCVSL